MGSLHLVTHTAHASPVKTVVACSLCGTALTPSEMQLNIQKGVSRKKFLCLSCWAFKGKGNEEQSSALSPVAPPPSPASSSPTSFFSCDDRVVGTGSSSLGDEAYYGSEALVRAADHVVDWEFEDGPFAQKRKPRKKVQYGRRGPVVVKRRPQKPVAPQKEQPVAAVAPTVADQSTQSIASFPFHMPRWWYFFPQVPGTPRNSELQVFYEDQHVFGTVSEHPAQELWCQGPKAVIVTNDGYTFFDMEKQERIFFPTREALDAYTAKEGITYEFKVVLQEKKEALLGGFDDVWRRINQSFDEFSRSMNGSFDEAEREHRARVSAYEAMASGFSKKHDTGAQDASEPGESGGNSLEQQFLHMTIKE